MSKHKHYDLIIEWCKNPQKYNVEVYDPYVEEWLQVRNPDWNVELSYRLVLKEQAAKHTQFHELGHNIFFTFVDEVAKIALGRCRKIIIPSGYFGNQHANQDDRSMYMDESGTIRKCLSRTPVELGKE